MRDPRRALTLISLAIGSAVSASACRYEVIGDWPTEIHGQLVDEDELPIRQAFVRLEVVPLISFIGEPPGIGVETTRDGRFALRGIRPGRYIAKFNTEGPLMTGLHFLPTESAQFLIEEGKVTIAPTLAATRTDMIEIEGMVNAPDGTPVQNALLDFWLDFPPRPSEVHSARSEADDSGRFVVRLSKDARYIVRVGPEDKEWGRGDFVANGEPLSLTARPR